MVNAGSGSNAPASGLGYQDQLEVPRTRLTIKQLSGEQCTSRNMLTGLMSARIPR